MSGRAPGRTPTVAVEFETQRIADCNHQLTALETLEVAKPRSGQGDRLIHAQKGKIGIRVVADEFVP